MPIKYTSGAAVISKVANQFKVSDDSWIPYVGSNIYDVLKDLNCPIAYEKAIDNYLIFDTIITLPDNYESVDYAVIDGFYIPSDNYGFNVLPQDLEIFTHKNIYCHFDNRTISFYNAQGKTVELHYTKATTEIDDSTGAEIPMVPNDNNVIDACAYNVMIQLILNGYVHSTFNLKENNPYTNVGMLYDKAIKKARNSVEPISREMRYMIHLANVNPFKPFTKKGINNVGGITPKINLAPIGGGYGDLNFVFDQVTPTKIWVINHNLNKQPSITTTDMNGKIIYGSVVYTIATSQVTITFGVPVSGHAILN